MIKQLDYTRLRNFVYPQDLNFNTTEDIEAYTGMIGQERAAKALTLGLKMKSKGYNIYISGLPGSGRTTFAKQYASKIASSEPIPPDLCYVYNFKNPKVPKLLKLPAGIGKELRSDMEELINRLVTEIPRVFSEKDYENSKSDIIKQYTSIRDLMIKEMTTEARKQNFGVKSTNTGIYFMPIINDEMITEEQFEELSEEEKDLISEDSESIQIKASEVMRSLREYEKKTRRDVDDLEYSIGLFTVGHHMGPLFSKYGDDDCVLEYLRDVREDILDNISDFSESDNEEESMQNLLPWINKKSAEEVFSKYKVNLLVDNSELMSAPVIVDFNPTYANLVGEIEYDNEFGNLTTDFMKIRPGILHRANGGYLILQMHDIMSNVHSWETLRRVLLTQEIVIEPLREFATGVVMSGIKPESVELNLKVILIGDSYYYDVLYEFDDEFQKLFKIPAVFDYEMDMSDSNIRETVRFIGSFASKMKTGESSVKDFDLSAVIKILNYSSRLAESQKKMTARFNKLTEILSEAMAWAEIDGATTVTEKYVDKATVEKEYRLNMYEQKINEMIEDDIIMIDVHGSKVGQINGLAVFDMGDYTFGKPSRITATTYVGKSGIINIEKEAEMSGNIHDKGIQVLTGYLGQTYAQDFPLSLACRVCFEQNYSGIDGDSASSTELYAILSSLSELPINQEIAVTGSINQRGEIQPIGGVTFKIEGFYSLCEKRGLTGKQGVIIPFQNINDLVLKDEVIEAVKDGMFHIYAISHVDDGIKLLTGVPAGEKNDKGKYPAGSVHGRVLKRLKEFHKKSIDE